MVGDRHKFYLNNRFGNGAKAQAKSDANSKQTPNKVSLDEAVDDSLSDDTIDDLVGSIDIVALSASEDKEPMKYVLYADNVDMDSFDSNKVEYLSPAKMDDYRVYTDDDGGNYCRYSVDEDYIEPLFDPDDVDDTKDSEKETDICGVEIYVNPLQEDDIESWKINNAYRIKMKYA